MKLALLSAAFWMIVAIAAGAIFMASNLAGVSGTPTNWVPAGNVLAVGAVFYAAILIVVRRRKNQ